MKRWKWVAIGIIGLAQLIQPDRALPESDPAQDLIAITRPASLVARTLRTSCYDCHSNTTRYPWYAYVTPVNWWLQKSHVQHARHHLNFSEWGTYSLEDRTEAAEEAMEMVSEGEMPLASYLWLHGDARLSDAQRKGLLDHFAGLQ